MAKIVFVNTLRYLTNRYLMYLDFHVSILMGPVKFRPCVSGYRLPRHHLLSFHLTVVN